MNRREQIELLNQQVDSLKKQIEAYQTKEQAIVQALTEAQAAAANRIEAAEARAKEILRDAEARNKVLEEENERLQNDAQGKADEIIRDAEIKAEEIIAEAKADAAAICDESREACRRAEEQLTSLQALLMDTAKAANISALAFEAAIKDMMLPGEAPELPEEYTSPSNFLHSMYQLEGRDIPQAAQEAAAQEAPAEETEEERVWTVEEVMANTEGETPDEPAIPTVNLDDLLDDILKD